MKRLFSVLLIVLSTAFIGCDLDDDNKDFTYDEPTFSVEYFTITQVALNTYATTHADDIAWVNALDAETKTFDDVIRAKEIYTSIYNLSDTNDAGVKTLTKPELIDAYVAAGVTQSYAENAVAIIESRENEFAIRYIDASGTKLYFQYVKVN
jgi:hypothetical protein